MSGTPDGVTALSNTPTPSKWRQPAPRPSKSAMYHRSTSTAPPLPSSCSLSSCFVWHCGSTGTSISCFWLVFSFSNKVCASARQSLTYCFLFLFCFSQNKECVKTHDCGVHKTFLIWGERSTPAYLLPKRGFGTRTRVVSAKGALFVRDLFKCSAHFFSPMRFSYALVVDHELRFLSPIKGHDYYGKGLYLKYKGYVSGYQPSLSQLSDITQQIASTRSVLPTERKKRPPPKRATKSVMCRT